MDPPTLVIAAPSQNAYVAGAVSVSGTAVDDLGVKSVSAKVTLSDRTITRDAVLADNGAWSLVFPAYAEDPANGIPDGERRIEVTATDMKGRNTVGSVVVFMDTIGPTVVVTVPSSYGSGESRFVVSDSISVKGEAWDVSPFSRVELSILSDAGDALFAKTADGTASWSARINLGSGKDLELADGSYRFVVRAFDRAGNPSTRFFHMQDVWAALSPGTATSAADIDTIGKADQLGAAFPGNWAAVEAGAFVSFPFVVNNQLPEVSFTSPTPAAAAPDLFGGDAMTAGGVAVPSLGARIVKVFWAIKNLDQESDAAAPTDDSAWSAANLSQIGSTLTWDAAIALKDRPEGSYRVFAKALDAGGVYSEVAQSDFYYDKSAPSLSVPALAQPLGYAKADIPLAWTISDSNGLAKFQIVAYDVVNGAKVESSAAILLSRTDIAALPAGTVVSETTAVDVSGISTAVKLFEAIATDKAGRTTTASGRYVVDRVVPLIADNEPTPSLAANASSGGLRRVNGSVTFKGYVSDDNEIKQLYVSVGDNVFTPGEIQPSAYSYTAVVDTTLHPDAAPLTIFIRAVDICGNVADKSVSVYVDQASDLPVVSLLSIDAANVPASAAPADIAAAAKLNRLDSTSLVLQVSDDDGINAGALQLSFDGGSTWTSLTSAQQPAVPGGVERAATYVLIGAAQASEGAAKTLRVRVADKNGVPATRFTGSDDLLYEEAVYWVDLSSPAIALTKVGGTGIPYASLSDYDGGTIYTAASFTVWGTVSDGSAVSSVRYSLNGADWLDADELSGGIWRKTFSEAISGIYLQAADEFGKTTTTARMPASIAYDVIPPSVSFIGATPIIDPSYDGSDVLIGGKVNGSVTIKGTASDANPLASVSYRFGGDIGDASGYTSFSGNLASWTIVKDTTTMEEDVPTTLYVRARDGAGNETIASIILTADQDTDKPIIRLSSINAAEADPKLNRLDSTAFALEIEDDDGIAANALLLRFSSDGGATWTAWLPTTHSAATGGIAKTVNYALAGGAAAEGAAKLVQARVADSLGVFGTEFTDGANVLRSAATYWVDLGAPSIDFASVDGAAYSGGTLYRNLAFTLAGSVADGSALASVKYSFNGTDWFDVDSFANGGSWTRSLSQTITGVFLRAVDEFGKSTTTARIPVSVVYDVTPPTTSISAPAFSSWHRGTIALSGAATDIGGSGVASVRYAVTAKGADPVEGDWKDAAIGAGTWSGSFDASPAGVAEGEKTLHLSATDNAGNAAVAAAVDFGVDKNNPTLSGLSVDGSAYTAMVYRSGGDVVLSGSAADTYSLATVVVEQKAPAGTWTAAATLPAAGTAAAWSWTRTFTGADAEGQYDYRVVAWDAAGNPHTSSADASLSVLLDRTAPAAPVAAAPLPTGFYGEGTTTLRGSSGDPLSGIASVQWSSDGGAAWTTADGTTAWTYVLDISDASPYANLSSQGFKTILVRAVDRAGNVSSNGTTTFWIDRVAPAVAFDSPAAGLRANGASALPVVLSASDFNGIASVELKAGSNDFSSPDATAALNGGTGKWEASIPAAAIAALASGTQRIYARARDIPGRTTTVDLQINVDKNPPTVSFTAPAADATVNKTISLAGTASDDQVLSNVSLAVWNQVSSSYQALPAPSGAANWTASLDTLSFDAAAYDRDAGSAGTQLRLRATAADEAGNSASSTLDLTIDQNSDRPVVKLSNIDPAGSTILKLTRIVYGTVSDDDGAIGAAGFRISEDGSNWVAATTYDAGTWSYQASAGDGSKTLQFRVIDAAGTIFATDAAEKPRVQNGAGYWEAAVVFRVDTVTPEIDPTISVDKAEPYDFASDVATLTANSPFGGPTAKFSVRTLARDANGIASVVVNVPGVGSRNAAVLGEVAAYPGFTAYSTAEIDVGALPDGSVDVAITVTDGSGLSSTATRTIVVDNTGPSLSFLDPASAAVVNGEVTVTGTSTDEGSGLQSVSYRVGKDYASGTPIVPEGSMYVWRLPFTGSNSLSTVNYANAAKSFVDSSTGVDLFILPIVVTATDKAGNIRSTAPIEGVGSRPNTTSLTDAALAGSSRVAVGQVAIIGGNARVITAWNSGAGTLSWSGAVAAAETAYSILEYSLRIDPDGDKPTAAVNYPASGATLGGLVRVYGTAVDDDGVASVWMQIDTNGDGSFTAADDAIGGWYNGGGGLQVAGSANWNQTLNSSGEFNPAGSEPNRLFIRVRALDIYETYGPWSNPVEILIDNDVPLIGSAYALKLDPDDDPENGNEIPYTYGMFIKGNWILRGSIEDETALAGVAISGALSGTLDTRPDWFILTTEASAPHTGKHKRIDLKVPISSPADTATTWNFSISATDVSEPARESSQALRLNIDTKAPTAALNATATPPLVQQSNGWYKIKGTAIDDGSDVDRVEVFFIRRGNGTTTFDRIYNPAASNISAALSGVAMANGVPVKIGTAGSRTPNSLTDNALIGNPLIGIGKKVEIGGEIRTISEWFPGSGRIVWADGNIGTSFSAYTVRLAIAVDHKDIVESWNGSAVVNDDADGYVEYLKQESGTTYTWFLDMKSDNIPDGPIEIHYVVFDSSGNAASYQTSGYKIQNNGPRVAGVWLGTDLDLSGGIDESIGSKERELFSYADATSDNLSLAASFKVKEAPMYILPVVTNGNGDLSLVLSAGPNAASLVQIGAPFALRSGGSLAPVALDAAALDGIGEGSRHFRFVVWDSTEETTPLVDSLSMTRDFACEIGRIDAVIPHAIIRPFYWNSASDNSLFGNSRANGHIEISGVYDGPDPDVSGMISIRGTAYDDQRLTALWLHIDGFSFPGALESRATFDTNGDGVAETLSDTYYRVASFASPGAGQPYAWTSVDRWSSDGWKFTVIPGGFDQDGHSVSWRLDWDSAKVGGVAAANRSIRVIAEDKRSGPNASPESAAQTAEGAETPLYRVDVVPYITSVSTTINSLVLADFNRSALGRYPVKNGESVTLSGFNLAPATLSGASSDVRLSIDPDAYDATYANKQGTGLTSSAPNSTYTSLTVSVSAAGSGYLTVITGGVPSINNVNSTAAYNQESTSVHQLMHDDRFFSVWGLTTLRTNPAAPLAANALYPSMVVSGNTPQFAYVNNSGGYGLAEFWNGTAEVEMYENWDLFTFTSLALNDSGSRAALYDINIVQSGTNFIGDKGGITVNMFFNPPNTTWNGTTYHYRDNNLWLDNLYHPSTLAVLDRYRYPDIKMVGTDALSHAYYGVYDSINDQILFRYFRVGTNQNSVGGGAAGNASRINDSGTALYVNNQDLVQRNQNNTWPTYTDVATNNTRIGQNNNSGNTNAAQTIVTGAGEHVAVDGTSGGVAVIAYYRTSDNALVYQYNTAPTASTWSTPLVLDSNIGAEFIDLVVDAADRVHIAYYDSFNGDVKYALIDTYDATSSTPAKIDSYLSVGSKLSLSVNSANVPYIAYRGVGNTAKIAWLAGTLGDGVDAVDKFNQAWEVQVLPHRIIDSDSNRFNVGVGTDGRAVVGYSNALSGAKGIEYLTALADLSD